MLMFQAEQHVAELTRLDFTCSLTHSNPFGPGDYGVAIRCADGTTTEFTNANQRPQAQRIAVQRSKEATSV